MNLLKIRKALGLTQKQVAMAANTSEAEICLIERGKRNPTLGLSKRIASALGVTLDELIEEDDDKCRSAS